MSASEGMSKCEECGGLFSTRDVLDSMGVCKACIRVSAALRAKNREIEELREQISKLEAHMNPHDTMHAYSCNGCIDCRE